MDHKSTIIPCLRYDDARAMMAWLEKAFDFKTNVCHENNGLVVHAQMTFGNGMIMLGSKRTGSEYGLQVKQPSEIGGYQTQAPYIIVSDVDAHYAQAVAAGAKIVLSLKTEPHGRGYSCLDPEGFLWSFGDYDPWQD